ncbi:hypothetical protein WJX81_005121 [Elliptochloris bilobata]|uniref:Uncharacterized protein n=1 Tax=Elliptochloris bilobata TaxID=381761 RepID=A0AAW1R3R7_9CHLO
MPPPFAAAGQQQSGGIAEGLKKLARQVQGALPVVGLLSRLSAPSGGIGNDLQAYPEFARALLEAAPEGFNAAVSEWERRHGKAGQRRYVLLFLWMAAQGGGVVPGKSLANAARRLRVTQDIEIEVERFENARDGIYKEYVYVEKPKGSLRDKMDIAVDCLCRLSLGLVDGAEVPEDDAALLVSILAGAFSTEPNAEELARTSLQQRASRQDTYAV